MLQKSFREVKTCSEKDIESKVSSLDASKWYEIMTVRQNWSQNTKVMLVVLRITWMS